MKSNLLMNCLWYEDITPDELAAVLHVSSDILYNKIFGDEEFTLLEIHTIVNLLGLTSDETHAIFSQRDILNTIPVVRCKHCIHGVQLGSRQDMDCLHFCHCVAPDDFCSYGEANDDTAHQEYFIKREGNWTDVRVERDGIVTQTCSACKGKHQTTAKHEMPFICPNCGAVMSNGRNSEESLDDTDS